MLLRLSGNAIMILLLTIVTQVGGLAWLLSRLARWRDWRRL